MDDTTQTVTDQFRLTVDYGQSLEAMIAAGRYDWNNPNIAAERFPITGTGTAQFDAKLFHLDRFISSSDAVAAIEAADAENPWAPATIEHLLSFGATHPDEQCRSPIIALGSVARVYGDRRVPSLSRDGARRRLFLRWWCDDWHGRCRFLAVRNRSSGA